jgi:hypothetical protein
VMELVRFIVGLSGDGASLINAFNGGWLWLEVGTHARCNLDKNNLCTKLFQQIHLPRNYFTRVTLFSRVYAGRDRPRCSRCASVAPWDPRLNSVALHARALHLQLRRRAPERGTSCFWLQP